MKESMVDGQHILASLNEMIDPERFRKLHWEGTFEEYLSMVSRNQRIARVASEERYSELVLNGLPNPEPGIISG